VQTSSLFNHTQIQGWRLQLMGTGYSSLNRDITVIIRNNQVGYMSSMIRPSN